MGVLGALKSESSKSNLVTGVVSPSTSLEKERCMGVRLLPDRLDTEGLSETWDLGLVT